MLKETIPYKGYEIEIHYDQDAANPRKEWDNLATMYCAHRRYNLGDEQISSMEDVLENLFGKSYSDMPDYYTYDRWEKAARNYIDKHYIHLPLYLYDHSGITMNTTGFSCRWDSGCVGMIAVSKEDIRKEYKVKKISPKLHKQILEVLVSEVETYDQYLTGEVFGYIVKSPEGEELDSCWGFYGDNYGTNGLFDYAHNAIDCHIKSLKESHFKRLKDWIKNKVPFIYRTSMQLT